MGKHGKRARSGSLQRSEGGAEDPLARLRAFQARMFDPTPEAAARTAVASTTGDAIPSVQWKAGKKSKPRKKQRLVDAEDAADEAVPTVKRIAVANRAKKKKKVKAVREEAVKETEEEVERSKVVRIPGQSKPRAAIKKPVTDCEAPKKLKHRLKKKPQVKTEPVKTQAKASTSFNDAAAKPFEDGEDPLAAVMRRVQEKMDAENAKSVRKTAFVSSMATDKTKKKKKKRKAEVEVETKDPPTESETATSGDSAAVDGVNGVEPEAATVKEDLVQPDVKKRKVVEPSVKKEDVSEAPVPLAPSTSGGVCASTASLQKSTTKSQKKKMTRQRLKLQKLQKLHESQQQEQPQQQPPQQETHVKVERQNDSLAPSKPAEPAQNGDAGTHSLKQEGTPARSVVIASSPPQLHSKPKAAKKLNKSQPKQQQAQAQAASLPASVETPSKPVLTPAIPIHTPRPQPLPAFKPTKPVVSDSSDSGNSDRDSDACQGKRRSLPAFESDDEAADASDASSSSSSEDDARPGHSHQQRQLFSALIDEAARDKWELAEVGRLVRLFSALGWERRTRETAKFLGRYCPELVSAEFLDGLDVKLSSQQLLGIFERGSGNPQVFLNKVASAIENSYLQAKDPAVAAALTRKLDELPDPSTRGVCEFLLPLLESLSTVRDVGVILRRMVRHWQPQRAASLVQHVLLTSVVDDLEGDQDELLELMPQLKGLLDLPSRMDHEDADEDGNLAGLIASEDEGEGDKHEDEEDEEVDDPEAALGEILSDDEDEDEDEDDGYEGETDSEEEREAAIRYGPDQRRRRSRFIQDEADESDDEEEGDDDGWEELVGSEADD